MKKPSLKLVESAEIEELHEQQLSLFEWHQPCTIICTSLDNLHGAEFVRMIDETAPAFIVDFRKFPHFDLTSLDRASAVAAIYGSGARYLHMALELGEPSTQEQRWTLRRTLIERFSWLKLNLALLNGRGLGFVGSSSELQTLRMSARQIPGWSIKLLKDVVAAQ